MEQSNSIRSATIYVIELVVLVLLVVISLTPSLSGFTGVLLLTKQVACLTQEVPSMIFVFTRRVVRSSFQQVAQVLLRQTAKSVSMCYLIVINVISCLAVIHLVKPRARVQC